MASKFMTPWDPFGVARSLRSGIDRLIEDTLIRPAGWLADWEPGKAILPLDVCEEGDHLIVTAAMPGLKPEQVKVEVQGNVLTVVGESKLEQESDGCNHRLLEHFYGRLERSVVLPALVDANKVEAVLAKGVLTVALPKTGETQTSQIAIKPAEKDQTVAAQPVAAKPAETLTGETQTVAAQPVEVEPVEVKPVGAKPAETQTIETQTVAAQPVAVQQVEAKPAETQTVEVQPVAVQTVKTQKVQRRKVKRQKIEAEKVA